MNLAVRKHVALALCQDTGSSSWRDVVCWYRRREILEVAKDNALSDYFGIHV